MENLTINFIRKNKINFFICGIKVVIQSIQSTTTMFGNLKDTPGQILKKLIFWVQKTNFMNVYEIEDSRNVNLILGLAKRNIVIGLNLYPPNLFEIFLI